MKPIENMLSHELRKNKIDGEKQIIQNPGEKQRSEMTKCTFDKFEVFALDILMSTGEGNFIFDFRLLLSSARAHFFSICRILMCFY